MKQNKWNKKGCSSMNKCIFAGLCSKVDVMLYICKVLSSSGHKTVLIDATDHQFLSYSLGHPGMCKGMIEFEGFDIAYGFHTEDEVQHYLVQDEQSLEHYDYVIIDTDNKNFLHDTSWQKANARIWVSNYERYTLQKGKQWLQQLCQYVSPICFHLLFINDVDCALDKRCFLHSLEQTSVVWKGVPIFLPWDEWVQALKIENEHNYTIKFYQLPKNYKKKIGEIIVQFTNWSPQQIHKAIKDAERKKKC